MSAVGIVDPKIEDVCRVLKICPNVKLGRITAIDIEIAMLAA